MHPVPAPLVWEIDETIADVIVVDPASGRIAGRPTVRMTVDAATRMVVAVDVAMPGSARAMPGGLRGLRGDAR